MQERLDGAGEVLDFFFQAEDGIRDIGVTGVQTCALPISEDLRYGFRVAVLAAPCDARWRTEAGLELVGPRYFGYDFDYRSEERRVGKECRSRWSPYH